jgi:hypothetical protein
MSLVRLRHMWRSSLITRLASVSAAMLFVADAAHAQKWQGGVKVGAGQGGFTGSQEFVWTHTVPNFSFFAIRPFAGDLFFQPEIGFTRKVGVSTTPTSRLTLSADYLEAPLLFQLRRAAWTVAPFLTFGASPSIRLRCTLSLSGAGVGTSDDCDVVRGETSQRVDVLLVGGGGISWSAAGTQISLEGRITGGLVSSAAPIDASNPHSFGYSVLLGFSRAFGRPGAIPRPGVPVPPRRAGIPGLPQAALPPIPSMTIVTRDSGASAPGRPSSDPLDNITSTRRITVRAVNADARALLLAVAGEAGLDLVVSGDVRSRVSVTLQDVPVADALRAIIQTAGLSVEGPSDLGSRATITFYQLPVNVNTASAATIAARFGTSAEMANFIVESRPKN